MQLNSKYIKFFSKDNLSQEMLNSKNSKEIFESYNKIANKCVEEICNQDIDTRNYQYIQNENKYIGTLIISNYNKEMECAFLDAIVSQDVDLQLSIFYEKKNQSEIIKKITYCIRKYWGGHKNNE